MRPIKHVFFVALLPFAGVVSAFAQTGLTVSAGGSIFISGGTVFSLDSVVLTPSAAYTINGTVTETRDAIVTHPSPNLHIQRVFHFFNSLPSFSGGISFYYRDAELNSIPENALTLNMNDGVSWNAYTLNVTRDNLNNFVNVTGLTNIILNEATLAGLLAALPVTFTMVGIACSGDGATVNWTTAQELNAQLFVIEKSVDGTIWESAGVIAAGGNSNADRHYIFTDNSSGTQASYRIVAVDLDGRQTISATIKSSCGIGQTFRVYPNPVRNIVLVSVSTNETATLMLGLYDVEVSLIRQVQTRLRPGLNQFPLNMQGLAAGAYVLHAQWSNNNKVVKMIKN